MANNVYVIDVLATGASTVTINDDGTGIDWLDFDGIYAAPTSIRLEWTTVSDSGSPATSGSGFYFSSGNTGHRLVVNGLIENARGSNGNDFISGNSADNLLFGDQLASGPGRADTIGGGNGDDTIYGGAGNDEIGGAGGADRLLGDAGRDTISGGAGVDTIQGGAGADSMSGGSDIGDTVNYAASTAGVQVALTFGSATSGTGGDAAGDRITGFTDIIGSDFADVLSDTVSGEVAFGGNANTFFGGGGIDTMSMGGGDDTAYGGNARDFIFGGAGDDVLFGDGLDDRLTGGLGADTLTGGQTGDLFIYSAVSQSTSTSRDVIRDFQGRAGDRIDLRAIDAVPGGTNTAFRFIGDDAFSGVDGELRVVDTGTNIVVQGDVNGDRVTDLAILVQNVESLLRGDFLL